jgi:hypothetical protein
MSMARHIGLALAALVVVGCDSTERTTAPDLGAALSSAVTKVPVCHRQTDGNYVSINIAEAAYDTHIAHGDQPAGSGGLDANCQPQACPCFSAESVAAEVSTWDGFFFSDRPPLTGGFSIALYEASKELRVDYKVFFAFYDNSSYSCGTELTWVQDITQTECEACRAILLEYAPNYD